MQYVIQLVVSYLFTIACPGIGVSLQLEAAKMPTEAFPLRSS